MTALHISPYHFKMFKKNKEMEWSSKKKEKEKKAITKLYYGPW